MAGFKKVCIVAPDGLTAALAAGCQQQQRLCEVTVVGSESSYPALSSAAQVGLVTDNLFEGLRRTDFVVISHHNSSQSWSLREVIISCEPGTTICEFGRSVTEASRLLREYNRADVHYISISISGMLDAPLSVSDCANHPYRGRTVGLSPCSVEDLQAFSQVLDVLRTLGANVVAMSPGQHDRVLAEVGYMPRLVLMPVVRYWHENSGLLESSSTIPSSSVLDFFGDVNRQELSLWAEELFHSKGHLLPALDHYVQYLSALRQELASDKFGETIAQFTRQLNDLKQVGSATHESAQVPAASGDISVDSAIDQLNAVWRTIELLEKSAQSSNASSTEIESIRNLLNQTRAHLHQLSRINVPTPPPVVAAPVVMPAPQLEAVAPVQEPVIGQREIAQAPAAVYSPPTYDEPDQDVLEAPEAPEAPVEHEYETYQPSYVMEPPIETPVETHAPAAPTPEPFSHSGRDLWLHCGNDVQAFASAARVLADARIGVENVERQQGDQGMVVKLTLRDAEHSSRARDLLSQAGITVH